MNKYCTKNATKNTTKWLADWVYTTWRAVHHAVSTIFQKINIKLFVKNGSSSRMRVYTLASQSLVCPVFWKYSIFRPVLQCVPPNRYTPNRYVLQCFGKVSKIVTKNTTKLEKLFFWKYSLRLHLFKSGGGGMLTVCSSFTIIE